MKALMSQNFNFDLWCVGGKEPTVPDWWSRYCLAALRCHLVTHFRWDQSRWFHERTKGVIGYKWANFPTFFLGNLWFWLAWNMVAAKNQSCMDIEALWCKIITNVFI